MSKLRAFTMPKWGIEMVEGTVSEWSVKEGEPVAKGQIIVLIETDKIVNEVQAEFETTFVRLLAQAGDVLPVGALLGVMADGEAAAADVDAFIAAFKPAGAAAIAAEVAADPAPAAVAAPATAVAAPVAAPRVEIPAGIAISPAARALAGRLGLDVSSLAGSGRRGRLTLQDVEQASRPARAVGGAAVSIAPTTASVEGFYASPAAQRLAVEHGVDLGTLKGTGPRGRISLGDVAAAAGVSTARTAKTDIIRMSSMRKAIARQLTLSKSTIPHYYLRLEVNLDALIALRADLKRQAGSAPSLNDYLLRATALSLAENPDVNIQVHGDEIHRFGNAHIAVAVATDKGLITPVLRCAETKSAAAIAAELRPLVERARAGRLRADEIEGGSFTVSNLGMFGVEQFDAIINPPQGAILAIGAARRRAVERDGWFGFGSLAWLSLSCDHRAIDGAVGGRFLTTLRDCVESPQRL